MEEIESTSRERTTGPDGHHVPDPMLSKSSKPLHRFVQNQPKSLGIVILIFGCAEVLMGFVLTRENDSNSQGFYVAFWQGALFVVCGYLSIYTEIHPSKKMVTICLAMYVVSLVGIVVSIAFRIYIFGHFSYMRYRHSWDSVWRSYRVDQIIGIESIMFAFSLCVSGILIFLSTVARLAIQSTRTQVIIQHIAAPQSNTASN